MGGEPARVHGPLSKGPVPLPGGRLSVCRRERPLSLCGRASLSTGIRGAVEHGSGQWLGPVCAAHSLRGCPCLASPLHAHLSVDLVVAEQSAGRGRRERPGESGKETGEEGREALQRNEGDEGAGCHPADEPVLVPHAAAGRRRGAQGSLIQISESERIRPTAVAVTGWREGRDRRVVIGGS